LTDSTPVLPGLPASGEEEMSVKKIVGLCCLAAGAALITAGCGVSGLYSAAAKPATGPPVTLTKHAAPSALVMVVDGDIAGPALARFVIATALPDEDLDIIGVGSPAETVVASVSPAPVQVDVPGKPVPPGSGATAYQWAVYRKRLKSWDGGILAGRQDVVTRTQVGVSAWAGRLGITAKVTGLPEVGGDPGSMADECRLAAGAMAGLDQEAAGRFGSRRVIILYVANLGGIPQTAELAGDDVIVVTSRLPSAAAASTAQAKLIDAGANGAAVLGPEITAAQLARLAAAGLSEKAISETLSGSVLFADHSAVLLPGAGRVLTPLLIPLRRPGVTGVINGYAFGDGDAQRDYSLSHARAVAVAGFLEARGVPASSLVVAGHGASHLVAPAPAGAESRVVVVIEEP
jgi:outer membrane protein OmpA-like peptidoglycan-associated protein